MFGLEDALAVLVVALALDGFIGDPPWLWRRLPHPVALFGRLIGLLDRRLNDPARPETTRRARGFAAVAVIAGVPAMIAAAVQGALLLLPWPLGPLAVAAVAAVFLAQRSLYDHVAAVADALAGEGLEAARVAVSHVVGRDPAALDETGIARAAIETTAESFCDGIVAPAFWFALFGLPGIVAYKAINTADSMIGHKTPRHAAFGFAAARLDDVVNLIPARIAGALIVLVSPLTGASPPAVARTMLRDAPHHPSPNAGWPEAAMASALGVAVLGPTVYDGEVYPKPWLNAAGRRTMTAADIRRGLDLLVAACLLQALVLVALSWL